MKKYFLGASGLLVILILFAVVVFLTYKGCDPDNSIHKTFLPVYNVMGLATPTPTSTPTSTPTPTNTPTPTITPTPTDTPISYPSYNMPLKVYNERINKGNLEVDMVFLDGLTTDQAVEFYIGASYELAKKYEDITRMTCYGFVYSTEGIFNKYGEPLDNPYYFATNKVKADAIKELRRYASRNLAITGSADVMSPFYFPALNFIYLCGQWKNAFIGTSTNNVYNPMTGLIASECGSKKVKFKIIPLEGK
jgi:hypothetical protein